MHEKIFEKVTHIASSRAVFEFKNLLNFNTMKLHGVVPYVRINDHEQLTRRAIILQLKKTEIDNEIFVSSQDASDDFIHVKFLSHL